MFSYVLFLLFCFTNFRMVLTCLCISMFMSSRLHYQPEFRFVFSSFVQCSFFLLQISKKKIISSLLDVTILIWIISLWYLYMHYETKFIYFLMYLIVRTQFAIYTNKTLDFCTIVFSHQHLLQRTMQKFSREDQNDENNPSKSLCLLLMVSKVFYNCKHNQFFLNLF